MTLKKLFLNSVVLSLLLGLSVSVHAQWTFVGFVTGQGSFPSISVYSPTGAVIAPVTSGVARMLKTTNGGVNWTDITGNLTPPEFYCVWAVDGNTIYAGDGGANGGAGGNARLVRTTNGGTTWTTVLTTGGAAGFINGIVFSRTSPNVGIAQSDPPLGGVTPYWVQRTTDNGATWTLQSPSPPGAVASAQNSIICIDALFYGFGLNAAPERIGFTANGGTTWSFPTTTGAGTGGFVSGHAWSVDKLRGFVASTISSNISATTNGGTSWSSRPIGSGVGGYCNIKWIHGTNIVYLTGGTGAAGCVKRSSDGGVTWAQMTTASITNVHHFEYFKAANNAIYLYSISNDGSVLYYNDNSLVGIDPNNKNVPVEYRLEQNYPNPFNPSTTVKYALPKASNVTLKVYDMLGNEVMSVVNGYQSAGNYVEAIDASSLASGVYFYKLSAGDFTESKKMTVVK